MGDSRPARLTVCESQPKHRLDAPPPRSFSKIRMVMVSRFRIAALIIAIVTTVAAIVFFALGTHRPTIASNTAVGTWIIFVALTIYRDLSRTLNILCANQVHDAARSELVSTGSMHRSHLRQVD